MQLPQNLLKKLQIRNNENALRQLSNSTALIDFSSNDYLGFSKSEAIFEATHTYLVNHNLLQNGATGSRLLSGNHVLYPTTERYIAAFHQSEAALIFNSGYDANVGFFSCVPQKEDVILYDALCHASIRDGLRLSNAKTYKYAHNDFEMLEKLLQQHKSTTLYVVTESVFSMDGDTPDLGELLAMCQKHNAYLVLDEAHALGVYGDKGEGLAQMLGLHEHVFARIMTFGKGLGCHGAAILGSDALRQYLVNFARSFIYTTGLSPHSVGTILSAYQFLATNTDSLHALRANITHFNQQKYWLGLKPLFVPSKAAIQSAILPGNQNVKQIALQFQQKNIEVKAILSPTVPEGQERLRFCLHSYNSKQEITDVLRLLHTFVF
ncbi:aminotransferase class I/II-fold pyridoxal phosphate-dependent enzyme [Flavobacterium crassostreae]|uniref:8-amino-7-oxononanoate synthase n=1 Tax=Flavobacterium crassostreae TaxID=1763534 RepID=A0A1B9E084_9FLAO|nr:8-amino-7-oxononanoate synthase [Flavobacterium crassostreae]OCB75356.1 8-amino-7-oxononanoate synthase [Flavobacterium crassostreae]